MINIHNITGRPQSGKTMILLGALERMQRDGFSTLYVTGSPELAKVMAYRTTVTCTSAEVLMAIRDWSEATAIGLDLNIEDRPLVQKAIELLGNHRVPTFLIMTRTLVDHE